MSTTATPAADVNATDETVEQKTTTPADSSSKETKEESSQVDKLDTSEADEAIAKDLAKKGDSDEADDTDETEEPDDKKLPDLPDADEEVAKGAEDKAKGAEARKEALQTEIRDLVSQRNEIRKQIADDLAKSYRTETVEELEEQGLSPEEAEKEILRQENEMLKFNTHVADLNNTLNIEALQVMQDFPVFDPDSSSYDKDLAQRVRGLYERVAQTQIDEKTGLVISSNLPPYEFYKAFAETHQSSGEKSRVQGQIDGQKAADKELAAAEVPSSTAPKTQKQDPFLKGLLSSDD